MTINKRQSASALLEQLDELLEALKATSAGIGVYDQLNLLLHDWQRARDLTDRTHVTLLAYLLEGFRNELDPTELTELNGRLIRARHEAASLSASFNQGIVDNLSSPESKAVYQEDTGHFDKLRAQINGLQGSGNGEGEKPELGNNANNDTDFIERRVNSAYRNHLDRKRSEIEKIQDGLEQEAHAAIAQNREFGALLKTELAALQQISSVEEIEKLKDILIGGTRELLQGQQKLEERLTGSMEFMGLIRTDSEGLRDELNKVRLLSLTDEATGLPNRRAFLRRLEDEIGRAQRYGSPLSLALIDLDYFKQINDRYGHAAGDDVLKWYAEEPLAIFRHYDMVARYGGEEFSVLLPSTDENGARRALEKVRERIKQNDVIESRGELIGIPSFSAGLTLYRPGEVFTDFIDRADKALYRAKSNGRNRVEAMASASSNNQTG